MCGVSRYDHVKHSMRGGGGGASADPVGAGRGVRGEGKKPLVLKDRGKDTPELLQVKIDFFILDSILINFFLAFFSKKEIANDRK